MYFATLVSRVKLPLLFLKNKFSFLANIFLLPSINLFVSFALSGRSECWFIQAGGSLLHSSHTLPSTKLLSASADMAQTFCLGTGAPLLQELKANFILPDQSLSLLKLEALGVLQTFQPTHWPEHPPFRRCSTTGMLPSGGTERPPAPPLSHV